jgi:hypothetical protein
MTMKPPTAGNSPRTRTNVLNVQDYGATGDGTTDDTEAIQEAIQELPAAGGTVFFPPGTYKVTSQLPLPTGVTGVRPVFRFEGSAAKITVTGAISVFGHAMPADNTAADVLLARKFVFEGLSITGDRTSGQKGIDLACTSFTEIRNCHFFSLDTGVDLRFCLYGDVKDSEANDCATYGFRVRSGNGSWTGATVANSPSNNTRLVNCRNYARTGMTAGFYLEDSNLTLVNPTCEGNNPVNNIFYSASDSTIKSFRVEGIAHFENTPTTAQIRLTITGVAAVFDHCWWQSTANMIDATGSASSSVIHVTFPYLPSADFKGDQFGAQWVFNPSGTFGVFDPWDSANWASGTVPSYLSFNAHGNDGGGDQIGRIGTGMVEMKEVGADVAAPATNRSRLYTRDNGAGKTQLVVRFPTGAIQVIATEP